MNTPSFLLHIHLMIHTKHVINAWGPCMELCLFACFYVSFDKTIIRISYEYRNLHSYFLHLDSTSIANRQKGSSKHDNMGTTTTANYAYISTTTQYTIYICMVNSLQQTPLGHCVIAYVHM